MTRGNAVALLWLATWSLAASAAEPPHVQFLSGHSALLLPSEERINVGEEFSFNNLKRLTRSDFELVMDDVMEDGIGTFISVKLGKATLLTIFGDIKTKQVREIYSGNSIDPWGNRVGDPLTNAIGTSAICFEGDSSYCISPKDSHYRYYPDWKEGCSPIEHTGDGYSYRINDCAEISGISITNMSSTSD